MKGIEHDEHGRAPSARSERTYPSRPHRGPSGEMRRPAAPPAAAPFLQRLAQRTGTRLDRERYELRRCDNKPWNRYSGSSKAAIGFRRFHLRGLGQIAHAWTPVTLAYKLQRLHRLGARRQTRRGRAPWRRFRLLQPTPASPSTSVKLTRKIAPSPPTRQHSSAFAQSKSDRLLGLGRINDSPE